MLAVCVAENKGTLGPNQAVYFPDLDYREEIKKNLFTD